MASFKPDYLAGAEKCRCLVLLNERRFLPSLLAISLVQSRVQGEGEAKLPSFLTYRLILVVPATNRKDKTVTETQPSQLKNQKNAVHYRPISYTVLLRRSTYTNQRKRNKRKYTELHSVGVRDISFGRGIWYKMGPKHPFLYQTPRNIQKVAYVLDVTETAGQSSRPRVSVH